MHQRPELHHAVLQGCAGQQQTTLTVEAEKGLPTLGFEVLDVLGLQGWGGVGRGGGVRTTVATWPEHSVNKHAAPPVPHSSHRVLSTHFLSTHPFPPPPPPPPTHLTQYQVPPNYPSPPPPPPYPPIPPLPHPLSTHLPLPPPHSPHPAPSTSTSSA